MSSWTAARLHHCVQGGADAVYLCKPTISGIAGAHRSAKRPAMTQAHASDIAPDGEIILELAKAAIEALPEPYRVAAREVALRIEDFAEMELLEALAIEDPYGLTGLYDGVPLTEKDLSDMTPQHDQIFLFRRPILEEWIDRGNVSLAELITHVMVHELAHHFGWTDDQIAKIDPWWE